MDDTSRGEKKPRLIYKKYGSSRWRQVPQDAAGMLDVSRLSRCGQIVGIWFNRVDMTDEEWETLAEA